MFKKEILSLLLAFFLGVLLTLLLSLKFNKAQYLPFGSGDNKILNTRNGCVYSKSESKSGGIWIITVNKVGVK